MGTSRPRDKSCRVSRDSATPGGGSGVWSREALAGPDMQPLAATTPRMARATPATRPSLRVVITCAGNLVMRRDRKRRNRARAVADRSDIGFPALALRSHLEPPLHIRGQTDRQEQRGGQKVGLEGIGRSELLPRQGRLIPILAPVAD